MRVDIAHVADCPHLGMASSRVREALEQTGRDVEVHEVVVASEEAAKTLGMQGSPTILIHGRDPFQSGEAASLSCRLYSSTAGMQGAPSVADLVAALSDRGETVDADDR